MDGMENREIQLGTVCANCNDPKSSNAVARAIDALCEGITLVRCGVENHSNPGNPNNRVCREARKRAYNMALRAWHKAKKNELLIILNDV